MPYPGFKKDREQSSDKPRRKQEIDTAGKTETFWSANAKLITFIVCMVVLLATIGPWSVFQIVKWYDARQEEQNEVLITREQLDVLIAKGSELNWVDFDAFSYEVVAEDIAYIRKYEGENASFYLMVTSSGPTAPVESVLLVDVDNGHEQTELKAQE